MSQQRVRAKNFGNALKMLRTFQRGPRFKVPACPPSTYGDFHGRPSLEGMKDWLDQLELSNYVDGLTAVHITGSKGKGSTCAFISALLEAHRSRTGFPGKIGLYTSPHLINDTERIRINSQPVSEELFAYHAWEVIDRFQIGTDPEGPRFLQSMILIAMRIFQHQEVDIAIIETHTGARFCATNFIKHPAAVAITRVGLDHVPELGTSIEQIAWHKAGVFKRRAPAFASPQEPEVEEKLIQEARANEVELHFVRKDDILRHMDIDVQRDKEGSILPNLDTDVQKENLSLARAVVVAVLEKLGRSLTKSDLYNGVKNFKWPGRFQIIDQSKLKWFVDGAHNPFSIRVSLEWFQQYLSGNQDVTQIAILCLPSLRHDPTTIMNNFVESFASNAIIPHHIILTTDHTNPEDAKHLEDYAESCRTRLATTVEVKLPRLDALKRAAHVSEETDGTVYVLVTGSLYLAGTALKFLGEKIS